MCVLVMSRRAVQQRAPLKQNVKNEAAIQTGANMVLLINYIELSKGLFQTSQWFTINFPRDCYFMYL